MGCLDLFQIKGKTAVVTGASSGLGKYACMCYAEEGANVVLLARRKEKLEETAKRIREETEGDALALECDVSNEKDVKKPWEKHWSNLAASKYCLMPRESQFREAWKPFRLKNGIRR